MDEDLADEFEGAGEAARDFEDSLADLPDALNGVGAAATSAGSAARDAQGRFVAAGDGAQKAGQGVTSMGAAMAQATSLIAALATGALPSATQAGQALGETIGGALTGAADKAADALGQLGPEGEAAAAGLRVVAVAAAVTIGVLFSLMGLAVDVSQRVDLMRDRFAALAGSAAGGAAVNAMVEKLSSSLPFATAQIQGWALSLEGAGLSGARLEASIKAVGAATALMGAEGGAAAENLIKKLAEGGAGAKQLLGQIQAGGGKSNKLLADMGLSTKDLAAAMGMTEAAFAKASLSADQMNDAITKALAKKGAGPLADLGNELPNVLQKGREGVLSLFDALGPAVKPFMSEIKSLFGEFSKGGVAINALKPIVTSVFITLFSWATSAAHAIHAGFLLATIAALKVYIAVKPIIDKLKELAKSAAFITALKIAAIALAAPFVIVATVIGVVVLAVAALGAAFIAPFVAIGAALAYGVGAVVNFAGEAIAALASWVSGAASAAADFVSGLVQGILGGAGAVIGAVSDLASGALSAFKGIFGIASPSKVMIKHGDEHIAGGAAIGVKKGAGKVDDAMARLGKVDKSGGAKAKASRGGGDSGARVSFTGCSFFGTTEEKVREIWHKILEETDAEAPVPS